MSQLRKLLKNEYVFSVLTRFVTIAVSVLQSILVARYLGAALKGINASISSIASVGAIVLAFGMHQAYPYIRKKYGKDKIFDDYMTFIVCLYSVYLVLAVCLSLFVFKSPELKVAVVIIPVVGFTNVVSYVTLIEDPNKRNTRLLIVYIANLAFVVCLFLFTESSFFWAVSILFFINVFQAIVYVSSLRFRFRINKRQLKLGKELFSFGFLPMATLLMTTLNYKIDIIMLRGFADIITEAQIGIYSVGMDITDHISLIPDTLKGVLVSKLAKGAGAGEVAKVCRLSFWASLVICGCFLAVGKPLISLLYGAEYRGAYRVMVICAFGAIFIGYFKLIAQFNLIHKKQIRTVTMLGISVLINIVLNLILIPRYELEGAAFASGMGYFLSGAVFLLWFAKTNGIRLSLMFLPQRNDLAFLGELFRRKRQ